jgi:cytoskeleton protein RodZ
MEMEATTDNNTPDSAGDLSPGSNLKQAREAAEMSQEQVAEYLKITVGYIRALEADEYHKLPATPYVVGYLRAYSRLVEVDTDSLLEDFQSHQSGEESGGGLKVAEERGSGLSNIKRVALVLVAVLLVWGIAVWLFGGSESVERPVEKKIEQTIAPVVSDAETETVINTEDNVEPQTDEVHADDEQTEQKAAAEQEDVQPKAEQAETVAQADTVEPVATAAAEAIESPVVVTDAMDSLVFNFTKECWLEITDANGDVLAADLYQAGDTFEAAGKAPFAIKLGNVRAADVLFNGKVYKLEPNGFRKTLRTVIE